MRIDDIRTALMHVWPITQPEAAAVLRAGSWASGEPVDEETEGPALRALVALTPAEAGPAGLLGKPDATAEAEADRLERLVADRGGAFGRLDDPLVRVSAAGPCVVCVRTAQTVEYVGIDEAEALIDEVCEAVE